ncbi:hypothetical protein V2J97_17180, partial [Pseudomonas alliivorans]|nr:hypothetical protein [Pseudomonas alliivorans]
MITAKVRVDAVRRILGSALQTVTGRFCWPTAAIRERLLSADSVEKVGSPKWPEYWPVKTPFLHAA